MDELDFVQEIEILVEMVQLAVPAPRYNRTPLKIAFTNIPTQQGKMFKKMLGPTLFPLSVISPFHGVVVPLRSAGCES